MSTESTSNDERTYHRTKSAYVLPNDKKEHYRLESQAERLRELTDDRIIHAPLECSFIRKIVDIGCGTGIVTNELGAAFPDAKIYGVDLTPVPALRPKLENIEYIEGDVFELISSGLDTRVEKGSFDYVFSRFLMAGMTEWERYVKLCAALTKPGGWVEMQEPDITVHLSPPVSGNAYDLYPHTLTLSELEAENLPRDDSDPEPWRATLHNLFRARGFEPSVGSKLAQYFADAGLQDIRIKRYVYPYGTWEGMPDAQRHYAPINKKFVENEVPVVMRKLSIAMGTISSEEVDRLVEKSRAFVERFEGNGEFGWVYVVCGRKADGEDV